MLHDAGAHVHDPPEPVPPGRLEDIPHPLEVDEEGVHVVLVGGLVPEVGGQVDDAVHALEGPVDGVEVGQVPVVPVALPVAVELAVHRPGFGVVIEGAHLVAAGEVLEHGPPGPPGGAHDGHFHDGLSPSDFLRVLRLL